jgi:hypothetical protein
MAQVGEDTQAAAQQVSAAGGVIIESIQSTGADMIAASLTRWDELKGAERAKIEETIRSAQAAVDTGQILLPEALERVKTALHGGRDGSEGRGRVDPRPDREQLGGGREGARATRSRR